MHLSASVDGSSPDPFRPLFIKGDIHEGPSQKHGQGGGGGEETAGAVDQAATWSGEAVSTSAPPPFGSP